jgi:hypothetical protein
VLPCLYAAISAPTPKKPAAVRRTSSVTDEDRENALKIRKNALKSDGSMSSYPYSALSLVLTTDTAIDLAAIARSSVAVSGSPPKDNAIMSNLHVSERRSASHAS